MKKKSKYIVLLLCCLMILSCKDFHANNLEFNSKEWQENDLRLRGRMHSDLLRRNLLTGKTKEEVIQILGNPDEEYENTVKYGIDLGSIFERRLIKYFIFVTFDEQTKIVKSIAIGDS